MRSMLHTFSVDKACEVGIHGALVLSLLNELKRMGVTLVSKQELWDYFSYISKYKMHALLDKLAGLGLIEFKNNEVRF